MWKFYKGLRGDNLRRTGDSAYIGSSGKSDTSVNTDWRPRQYRVKSEENDYLVCVPYNSASGAAGTKEFKVAKPYEMRGGAERWGVYPPYVADTSVIWAASFRNNGAEDTDGNAIALMDMNFEGRRADGFWAEIGAATAGGTNKWTYAATEKIPSSGGYTTLTDGRSITGARNSVENSNSATGTQGNSIDIDGTIFDDNSGLAIQPVEGSPVVWVTRYQTGASAYEYRFEYVNAIDGECA